MSLIIWCYGVDSSRRSVETGFEGVVKVDSLLGDSLEILLELELEMDVFVYAMGDCCRTALCMMVVTFNILLIKWCLVFSTLRHHLRGLSKCCM